MPPPRDAVSPDSASPPRLVGGMLWRGGGLLALWVLLVGSRSSDPWVGAAVATAASWASVRLLPPGGVRLRAAGLPRLAAHLLWQSIAGGFDVARRAFDPRLPLRPGYRRYRAAFPEGTGRHVFGALTAVVPGMLPVGAEPDGTFIYHCLDAEAPVQAQLAADETILRGAMDTAAATPLEPPRRPTQEPTR